MAATTRTNAYAPMNQTEAELLAADMNATGTCQAWAEGHRNGFIGELWVVMFWTPEADEPHRCSNRDQATRYFRVLAS